MRILVTDGDQRAALAVVRSLGIAGHDVFVGSTTGRSIAGASRHSIGEAKLPDPLRAPADYQQALLHLVASTGSNVVIPISEPALLCVLDSSHPLRATVPFPKLQAFLAASDKAHVTELAEKVGLHVPEQSLISSRATSLGSIAWLREGVVLKPARSVKDGTKLSVEFVEAGADVGSAIARLPAAAFPLLVQRRVYGHGTGVFLLRWDGKTVAAFAHRRIREKPPAGGVSVVREGIPLDPELRRKCEFLLDELEWQGVAMLEFKQDASGRSYLMEINGRFWGSLQLAIDSGVDFPALLVRVATGDLAGPIVTYRDGVRSRWLLGDVDHLIARVRRSPTELALPADAPSLPAAVGAFLRDFLPPSKLEVLRVNDMRPFLRELRQWLGHALVAPLR